MQTFNLDLSEKRGVQRLNVKQRDVGAKIQIVLTDDKKEYNIPDGTQLSVWFSGRSGEGNYTKIDGRDAFSIDGNKVTVELIYQMLNNPGEHAMCLVMNGADGTQLGLWNIPYFVEPIPGADGKPAIAYYQAFLKAQENAEKAAQEAKDAAKVAAENAVAAVVQEIDVSKAGDGSILLRLYSSGGGYDATVTGTGAIKDYTPDNRPYDAKKICTLHIGDGITGLGAYFMYGALNLKELTFGANCKITKLSDGAFRSSGITEASFPYLTEMGNTVFNSCTSLVSANLGGNITTLPLGSFSNCLELEKITGLGNVKTIEIGVFRLTPKLSDMDFDPAKLNEVKALAFYASGFEYDWESLPNCAFGSFAIPSQLNEDAPWEELRITECENPVPTLFDQNSGKWANKTIGTSAISYMDGCVLFSFIHAYCGLTGQHMDAPTELTGDVLNGYESDIDYIPVLAEAFGLDAVKYDECDAESLQALYDALAEGKYAPLHLGGRNIGPVTDEDHDNDWASLGGHVVIAYGVRRDGKLLIADSSFTSGEGKGCTYALHPKAFIPSASVYKAESAFTYILEKENVMLKSIDERLKTILDATNSGFHTESGTLEVATDSAKVTQVTIPCSDNAKLIVVKADDATYADIMATGGSAQWMLGYACQCVSSIHNDIPTPQFRGWLTCTVEDGGTVCVDSKTTGCQNSKGIKFNTYALKAGKYNWTAYYWNEEE